MATVKPLEDALFDEVRARVQEDDSTVPVLDDGYWSYARFETGTQYPIFARRKRTMQAAEEIVLRQTARMLAFLLATRARGPTRARSGDHAN